MLYKVLITNSLEELNNILSTESRHNRLLVVTYKIRIIERGQKNLFRCEITKMRLFILLCSLLLSLVHVL